MRSAVRVIVASLLAIGGACAQPVAPSPAPASPRPIVPAAPAPAVPTMPALPSLDALASSAVALAPGMREIARGELSSDVPPFTRVLVAGDAPDTCIRVSFVAQPAVHASLTNARGDLLADAPSSADTPIGAHGPVCVRKGDGIKLTVEASGVWRARFVAWSSP